MSTPAIEIEGLSKSFGGVRVLHEVGFTVERGEIHGLVGRNGSGKSTLIKILSGYHHPDAGGSLRVAGRDVPLPVPPGHSQRLGLSFVHQDLGLTPGMTIMENIRIDRFETSFGWRIRWRRERERVRRDLERFDIEASPSSLVSDVSPVDRALVAIVRALTQLDDVDGGVLVLDEPTAYLPFDGVGRLFDATREAARNGTGVIFVSHRLEEITALTHRVSVLRDGHLAGTVETAKATEAQLIELIAGGEITETVRSEAAIRDEVILRVDGLSGRTARNVSFVVRSGEVLGLTGLIGMGHEELPYLLFGARPANDGSIEVRGKPLRLDGLTPGRAMRAGVALVPADRQRASGVPQLSLRENLTLPNIDRFFILTALNKRRETVHTRALLEHYGVRPASPGRELGTLSGGNQQKALLAKWFQRLPDVLLLHEPTQGVDVGAREDIFREIRHVADTYGTGILFISSDYDDFARICDRVLVFRYGSVVGELAGSSVTQERIIEACYSTSAA
ncbi:MAG TPA: sugar ABC transporter ATP-binding protein [Gaiellaceae bacterium]